MKIILRFTAVTFSIIGAIFSVITFALINNVAGIGLSTMQIIVFGAVSGIITGIVLAYVLAWYIMRKAKKFLFKKLSTAFTSLRFFGNGV